MKIRTVSAALVLGSALALPYAAQASGTWHQTNTEIGYAIAPDHAAPGKTRDEVKAELAVAKSDPKQWFLTNLNLGKPGWAKQGTSRTRADAMAEIQAQTPAERARLAEIYTPG
ncbi:hypothetical protein LMG26858_05568 [Achromobacter anxifer]|jgi:hypothetical protein|uniref:DUF4148 domain-containing protein n=1 Tax=Achromobacter anxifer TaxID=1287737 RepID=A0A6S7EV67_9BURK|nr:DUF4148 domain-containing protein [Achromobacter anxifer]CAB3923863.1 hypothetical protein LMG26858_05568 [Achromobacter anxifer]